MEILKNPSFDISKKTAGKPYQDLEINPKEPEPNEKENTVIPISKNIEKRLEQNLKINKKSYGVLKIIQKS